MNYSKISDQLSCAFQHNFDEDLEMGASLALYHRGEKIISLYGGWCDTSQTKPWTERTLSLIWSAGKGIAATTLLHALEEKNISLEEKVATFWPEFAQAGKENITIAQLLSHRAGLAALDQKGLLLTDHAGIVEALAKQPSNWPYDGSHGYGARTFGSLVDELLRRLCDGVPLSSYWRTHFADPFEIDLWFGLPEAHLDRAATIIPPKTAAPPSDFSAAYIDPTTLTRRAFIEPGGSFPMASMNRPELRRASIVSSGAISNAAALAKFYSLVAMDEDRPFFNKKTRDLMETPMASGVDRVLQQETFFSAGLMVNNNSKIMGKNPRAFGHPGAGGTLAFADPEREWGFAYVPNVMHHGVLSGPRTQRLVNALYL
ncbi:MAG: serine hydrolase [Verrucomicrobiae bacterium]|jgi:CubicO group peptidase (beta-lactamase class C family)|nr:serine hydrolase [Verrucomicrobiae bacterium]